MPTEREQIEQLRKLLAKAELRASAAEAKVAKAEAKVAKVEAKAAEAEAKAAKAEAKAVEAEARAKAAEKRAELAVVFNDTRSLCVDGAKTIIESLIAHIEQAMDLPEANRDQLVETVKTLRDLLDQCRIASKSMPFIKALARKSERIGSASKQTKTIEELRAEEKKVIEQVTQVTTKLDKVRRSIEERQKQLRPQLNGLAQAVAEVAKEDGENASALVKYCAGICAVEVPACDDEKQPLPNGKLTLGRQKVTFLENARTTEAPEKESFCCPHCGCTAGENLGTFDVRLRQLGLQFTKLAESVTSAHRVVACHECGRHHLLVPASEDVPVTPQGTVGQELVLGAAYLEYSGIPVHRTETILGAERLQLGNSTLGDNMHRWAKEYGRHLFDALLKHCADAYAICADETPFTILQQAGKSKVQVESRSKKAHVLIVSSVPNAEIPFGIYFPLDGRGNEVICEHLGNFKPKCLITDGYQTYSSEEAAVTLKGAKHQSCLVHARRTIMDAFGLKSVRDEMMIAAIPGLIKEVKAKFRNGSPEYALGMVLEGLSRIYGIEKQLKPREGEARKDFLERVKKVRSEKSAEIMQNIEGVMLTLKDSRTIYNESKKKYEAKTKDNLIDKAVVYFLNRREELKVFLTDPEVPPDTNTAERCVRAIAVLENVCKFKQSPAYLESLCTFFTLFATAEACGVSDPLQWLTEFGRALYIHRAGRTLDYLSQEGLRPKKLCNFTKDSIEDFPFEEWLPHAYAARQMKA